MTPMVMRRIAGECTDVDVRGTVGIRLEPAAAIDENQDGTRGSNLLCSSRESCKPYFASRGRNIGALQAAACAAAKPPRRRVRMCSLEERVDLVPGDDGRGARLEAKPVMSGAIIVAPDGSRVGSLRELDGRQARGLRFLRWTANRAYDHKNVVRTPDFKDRLSAASTAKKAQIERARTIADDPARLRRIEARSEIIAARNIRIADRERVRREAIAREAAERAAAEAAEAAALKAARKAEEEARETRRVEQARRDAAAAAEREEALLAIRRAGRKKKRKGH